MKFIAILGVFIHVVHAFPGIPNKVDVLVSCTGPLDCGLHGQCRDQCVCDNGWSSPSISAPCSVAGHSQIQIALFAYFLGAIGVSSFVLGWTGYGVLMVVLLCILCTSLSFSLGYSTEIASLDRVQTANAMEDPTMLIESTGARDQLITLRKKSAIAEYIACSAFLTWVAFYIIIAILVSTKYCVSADGTPCKSW
jgi:hypothetical protein